MRLADILCQYKDTFVRSSIEMGLSKIGEHKIDTGTAEPVRDQPRRLPIQNVKKIRRNTENSINRVSNPIF